MQEQCSRASVRSENGIKHTAWSDSHSQSQEAGIHVLLEGGISNANETREKAVWWPRARNVSLESARHDQQVSSSKFHTFHPSDAYPPFTEAWV